MIAQRDAWGPWERRKPLVSATAAMGCCSAGSTGLMMMVLHRPFRTRGKLYVMRDTGDRVAGRPRRRPISMARPIRRTAEAVTVTGPTGATSTE